MASTSKIQALASRPMDLALITSLSHSRKHNILLRQYLGKAGTPP